MKHTSVLLLVVLLLTASFLLVPAAADTISINEGNSQTAVVGTAVSILPQVIVRDPSNNPVSGASVVFAIASGGGSVTGATTTTNAEGKATIGGWTLGTTAGANSLTATSGTQSATFTATGTAGPATQITANSLLSQSAAVSTAVAAPPTVVVKDAYGNPVSGTTVTFLLAGGGGSIGSSSAASDSRGNATVGTWILGAAAGPNTLVATMGSSAVTFSATGTTTASTANTISTISPTGGAKGSTSVALVITGTNFTTTTGSVRLERSNEADIVATVNSWTTTQIKCTIAKIPTGAKTGKWDVVVVKGYDQTEIIKEDAFSITDAMTLTSITPNSGQAGDDSVAFTIAGKELTDVEEVYLFNDDEDLTIDADDFDVESSIKITGTFDLEDAEEETYDVCVVDKYGAIECDLSYEVTTNEVGSIDISSSPSGASILIDGIAKGTTPQTIDDMIVGSHKVVLTKPGYAEWGRVVKVEADDTIEIDATLYVSATATPATATPFRTSAPTAARTTIKKSTIKVPTTWVDVPTTAPPSPADPAIVIGALGIGLGLIVIWRR
jgi:hypothetical protein